MISETPTSALVNKSQQMRLALTRRQQAFVEAYAQPGTVNGLPALNASEAVRRAGYSTRNVAAAADKLLRNPKVRAAVDAIRAEVAALSSYDAAKGVAEIDEKIGKAEAVSQFSAVAKLLELKLRVTGVLIDRIDARVAVGNFSIVMQGLPASEVVNG